MSNWTSGDFRPTVEGVYEIRWVTNPSVPTYSKWDGEQWMLTCESKEAAEKASIRSLDLHRRGVYEWRSVDENPWRSLDEKPTKVGLYRLRDEKDNSVIHYSWWNGSFWGYCDDKKTALDKKDTPSPGLNDPSEWIYKQYKWCKTDQPEPMENAKSSTSADLLNRAIQLQAERGKQFDADNNQQERSMAKTVEAFNAICGQTYGYVTDDSPTTHLTESQGWLFMCLLKMVRSESRPQPHQDSVEDLVSYASLYGEARLNGK